MLTLLIPLLPRLYLDLDPEILILLTPAAITNNVFGAFMRVPEHESVDVNLIEVGLILFRFGARHKSGWERKAIHSELLFGRDHGCFFNETCAPQIERITEPRMKFYNALEHPDNLGTLPPCKLERVTGNCYNFYVSN